MPTSNGFFCSVIVKIIPNHTLHTLATQIVYFTWHFFFFFCKMQTDKFTAFHQKLTAYFPLFLVITGTGVKCAECNESFKSYYYMRKHALIHTNSVAGAICPYCAKILCNTTSLDEHINRFHTQVLEAHILTQSTCVLWLLLFLQFIR